MALAVGRLQAETGRCSGRGRRAPKTPSPSPLSRPRRGCRSRGRRAVRSRRRSGTAHGCRRRSSPRSSCPPEPPVAPEAVAVARDPPQRRRRRRPHTRDRGLRPRPLRRPLSRRRLRPRRRRPPHRRLPRPRPPLPAMPSRQLLPARQQQPQAPPLPPRPPRPPPAAPRAPPRHRQPRPIRPLPPHPGRGPAEPAAATTAQPADCRWVRPGGSGARRRDADVPPPRPSRSGLPATQAPTAEVGTQRGVADAARAPAAVATLLQVAVDRGITHTKMTLRPGRAGRHRDSPADRRAPASPPRSWPTRRRPLAYSSRPATTCASALEARNVTLISLDVSTTADHRGTQSARGEWDGADAGRFNRGPPDRRRRRRHRAGPDCPFRRSSCPVGCSSTFSLDPPRNRGL